VKKTILGAIIALSTALAIELPLMFNLEFTPLRIVRNVVMYIPQFFATMIHLWTFFGISPKAFHTLTPIMQTPFNLFFWTLIGGAIGKWMTTKRNALVFFLVALPVCFLAMLIFTVVVSFVVIYSVKGRV